MKKVIGWRLFVIIAVIICAAVIGVYKLYPQQYKQTVHTFAKQYDVDPLLIYAIMKVESKYNPDAISRSGAKGLMQIMDKTGEWGAKQAAIPNYSHDILFKPEINIQIGCWYISKLLSQYEGNMDTALAAYNAGTGNVAKWRSNPNYSPDGKNLTHIPFKETKQYVRRVRRHYKIYQLLYRY